MNAMYGGKGNLIIKFNIVYPKTVDSDHYKYLRKVFGKSTKETSDNVEQLQKLSDDYQHRNDSNDQSSSDPETENVEGCRQQ